MSSATVESFASTSGAFAAGTGLAQAARFDSTASVAPVPARNSRRLLVIGDSFAALGGARVAAMADSVDVPGELARPAQPGERQENAPDSSAPARMAMQTAKAHFSVKR